MAEQRYKAVLAVVGDGRSITEVAASWGISRQTLHTWLARWESGGLEGLVDRHIGRCPVPISSMRASRSRSWRPIRGGVLAGSVMSWVAGVWWYRSRRPTVRCVARG